MEFRTIRVLRGPNIWARFPVLEVVVDFAEFAHLPALDLQVASQRLADALPTLAERRCRAECTGFLAHAREGGSLAQIFELVARELLALTGFETGFGRSHETGEPGVYRVAVAYREEESGRLALNLALDACRRAFRGEAIDLAGPVHELRSLDEQVRLGPSTGSIVAAARARGIPTRRLNSQSLVQLGYGARQHRILAAETDRTSAIAESIAQDKELTKLVLRASGVPVPTGRPATSAEDAWQAARQIGLPVVVKPQDGNQGRGVAVNLSTREQVLAAYDAAMHEGTSVLVERFAPGSDHRLLVIGNKVVAAARREPPLVIGDGLQSIAELVAEVNTDPRRGEDHATSLSKLRLDDIALGVLTEQGLNPQSVPASGQRVVIRRNANLSTGGSASDVTDRVHPEVAARAIDAARAVGLDIAGVDVVVADISIPLEQQGGVIVEVNAAPGLRMHLEPSSGTPQAVGEAIVSTLFPEGETGRIPVVAVTGTNGKTTTARCIAHLLREQGNKVGLTCTEGIFVDDQRIDTGDCSGPKSARVVLMHPQVQAAVLETARGGILREGLGFDVCDVAVVTNLGAGDHLGLGGIDTVEQLAAVKRTVVEAVSPTGTAVLNAEDPLVSAMADTCRGNVIYFACDSNHPVVVAHRSTGQRVVTVRDGSVVLVEGQHELPLMALRDIPLTFGGCIRFQIENVLASTAAAWALGLDHDTLRRALVTFSSDVHAAPARYNVLKVRGATVIVDYGHNASALRALVQSFDCFPHDRRAAVFSAAGDRRDSDIIEQAALVAQAFDHVVIYEDQCNRGRADGEIIALLRQGLAMGTRCRRLNELRGELNAIDTVLDSLQPRDLILIQADQVELAVSYIERRLTAIASSIDREALPGDSRHEIDHGAEVSGPSAAVVVEPHPMVV